jgi:hypothetical protein
MSIHYQVLRKCKKKERERDEMKSSQCNDSIPTQNACVCVFESVCAQICLLIHFLYNNEQNHGFFFQKDFR